MKTVKLIALILVVTVGYAQQPQTSTPVYAQNSEWTNGVAPGYWPTAGSGLVLNVSGGTANCFGSIAQYSGGTLTLAANTTNYVYLNSAASCVPATKTTPFTPSDITVAVVTTSGSAITAINDVRTLSSTGAIPPLTTTANTTGAAAYTGSSLNIPPALQTSPITSQTTSIPAGAVGTSGGSFSIVANNSSCANYSAVFTEPAYYHPAGSLTIPGFITTETESCVPPNNSVNTYMATNNLTISSPGTYTGTVWTGGKLVANTFSYLQRGIGQAESLVMTAPGVGDKAISYDYLTPFGGMQFYNDEGIYGKAIDVVQMGWLSSTINTGGTTGSSLLTVATPTCHANGGFDCSIPTTGLFFSDGGLIYDQTRGGNTVTITSVSSLDNAFVANVSGTPFAPSIAWGDESSCGTGTNDNFQNYFSVTCTITIGTSPTSPGCFVVSSGTNNQINQMYITGYYDEQVVVTAIGSCSTTQSVTFLTRHNWNVSTPNHFMQGGPIGQVIVQNSAWPIAWPIVGAYTSSQVAFGNCHNGNCNGHATSGNGILPSGGTTYLYPGAEIIGTNGGSSTGINIATNTVPWTAEDIIVGAPTSEYQSHGISLLVGQGTPVDSGTHSTGITVTDSGPSPVTALFEGINLLTTNAAPEVMNVTGSFNSFVSSLYRPWGNTTPGSVVYINDNNASGSTASSYYLLGGDLAQIQIHPNFGGGIFTTLHLGGVGSSALAQGLWLNTNIFTGIDGVGNSESQFAANNGSSTVDILSNSGASGEETLLNFGFITSTGSALNSIPLTYTLEGRWASGLISGGGTTFMSMDIPITNGSSTLTTYIYAAGSAGLSLLNGKTLASNNVIDLGPTVILNTSTNALAGLSNIASVTGTFSGTISSSQTVSIGPTPTMTPGTGAGTSPTCTSITGANMAGVISCTTGTTPTASTTAITITFNGTLTTAPQGCMLMPRNAATAAATGTVYTTAPTTSSWTIAVGSTALTASTAYVWSYQCE
jgi:hypothetical protein